MKQTVEQLDKSLDWGWLPAQVQWVIEQGIAIQQIPAPTFNEKARAAYVAEQFKTVGLQDIQIDDRFNVFGLLPGSEKPGVMISAHTDTVFDESTDLKIRRENDLIYGPGLGDNSMGVAGLLGLANSLRLLKITPARDIWFVANTREEGLGDLGGMKAAFARLQTQISQVINLEGMAFGHVYHAGIAVRRLHICATAEGGHSWLNYGRPSAVHGIVELGARITALRPPQTPRTTYNIGMIDGGQTINAIATKASLWLDMRSEESSALATFEQEVRAQVDTVNKPSLPFTIDVVGDRPAGSIPAEHPLVQAAMAVLAQVGVQGTLENGRTDANVPLAQGTPAVTIGITRGGNAHR
ncbi:MAG: M20/M25/M40 family metallo-hydrolase, partial [Anaerolineae bacterium]|nr:M20/M25/M40 family metallo-hydrolase [Anaerolineae bacterium]